MKRSKLRRRRAFDSRVSAGAEVAALGRTEYVAIHPFADEVGLLAELSLSAAECPAVDAYWRVLNDVVFVQVVSAERELQRSVGCHARWDPRGQQVVLRIVVEAMPITRGAFEAELKSLLQHGRIGRILGRGPELGSTLKHVPITHAARLSPHPPVANPVHKSKQRMPPMDRPRLYVDFNEMVERDLVLLSQTDERMDSAGNPIRLVEGLAVHVYMDDPDEHGNPGALIADGVVEPSPGVGWTAAAKWCCRIDSEGIRDLLLDRSEPARS